MGIQMTSPLGANPFTFRIPLEMADAGDMPPGVTGRAADIVGQLVGTEAPLRVGSHVVGHVRVIKAALVPGGPGLFVELTCQATGLDPGVSTGGVIVEPGHMTVPASGNDGGGV